MLNVALVAKSQQWQRHNTSNDYILKYMTIRGLYYNEDMSSYHGVKTQRWRDKMTFKLEFSTWAGWHLNLLLQIMTSCINKLVQHWFKWRFVACLVPSHYLNQCWFIVIWSERNRLQLEIWIIIHNNNNYNNDFYKKNHLKKSSASCYLGNKVTAHHKEAWYWLYSAGKQETQTPIITWALLNMH